MHRATATIVALSLALLQLAGCKVTQTKEGDLPDQIEVTPGELPEYDVDLPEVDVTMEERTIEVPTDVEITGEEREIDLPRVDVEPPPEE